MARPYGRTIIAALLLAGLASPAAADPLVMFLIGMAREMLARQAAAARAEPQATHYPGTLVQPEQLRRLIDDSFSYLGEIERGEIYSALHAGLSDPKNAAIRTSMIEYFAEKALAVAAAQRSLAQLSPPEKQRIAREFKAELANLPAEQRREFVELLRARLLPLPGDLNQLLLGLLEDR